MFESPIPRHIGDVNQPVDALFELDERAEVGQVANLAVHDGTDRISLRGGYPTDSARAL